jgi:hypothetical protein
MEMVGQIDRTAADIRRLASSVYPVMARATNVLWVLLGEAPPAPPPLVAATNQPAVTHPSAGTNQVETTGQPAAASVQPSADMTPEQAEAAALRQAAGAAQAAGLQVNARLAAVDSAVVESAAARQGVAAAADKADLGSPIAKLKDVLGRVQKIKGEIPPLIQEAQAALDAVLRKQSALESLRKTRAEEEERQRREAAHKALVEEELARVELLHAGVEQMVKQYRFAEAARNIEKQAREFKTDEGRRTAEAFVERYRLAAAVIPYLTAKLNAAPYAWGWERAKDMYEDVLGADENGVKLRGRQVPWLRVSLPQVLRFVEKYVANERLPGQQGRLYMGVAVMMQEAGRQEMARAYADKAVLAAPYLKERAELVVPPR